MSSDEWDSPQSSPGDGDWAHNGWANSDDADAGWGDQSEFIPAVPRPASVTSLWVGLVLAISGLTIGLYGLVSTGFASEVLPIRVVIMLAFGWLLSGICSVLALAVYQREDLKRALSAFYRRNPIAVVLRTATLVAGTIGVLATSYGFATWVARH